MTASQLVERLLADELTPDEEQTQREAVAAAGLDDAWTECSGFPSDPGQRLALRLIANLADYILEQREGPS